MKRSWQCACCDSFYKLSQGAYISLKKEVADGELVLIPKGKWWFCFHCYHIFKSENGE